MAQDLDGGGKETDKTKWNKLEATWFIAEDCADSEKDDGNGGTETADGVYHYEPAEVERLNKGFQGRFCWDADLDDNNDKWNPIDTKGVGGNTDPKEYYYSFSSTQKLPICPPPAAKDEDEDKE